MTNVEFPVANTRRSVTVTQPIGSQSFYGRIEATSSAVPNEVVTNEDIIRAYGHGVSANAMKKMVGVAERRVAPIGTVDSDLLEVAARRCLEAANFEPERLSKLIVTKFLGDRALPMTAAFLQRKLGVGVAVQAFDVDGGTHAFLQALHLADCAIRSGDGPILIVSGGVINCLVSKRDPRLAFQFGDGAAAVLLIPTQERYLLANYGFSNHEYLELARGFAVRDSVSESMYASSQYDSLFELYEERDIKTCSDFVKVAMKVTASSLLEQAETCFADVDLFLLTENHPKIRNAIVEHLGIPVERTLSLRERYGNTMSAMLPLLLDDARRTGRVTAGSLVMLLSLGEGLAGGGMLVRI
jgi:3-oxoacyl-[acyl-carrier-protein] synthase-3